MSCPANTVGLLPSPTNWKLESPGIATGERLQHPPRPTDNGSHHSGSRIPTPIQVGSAATPVRLTVLGEDFHPPIVCWIVLDDNEYRIYLTAIDPPLRDWSDVTTPAASAWISRLLFAKLPGLFASSAASMSKSHPDVCHHIYNTKAPTRS